MDLQETHAPPHAFSGLSMGRRVLWQGRHPLLACALVQLSSVTWVSWAHPDLAGSGKQPDEGGSKSPGDLPGTIQAADLYPVPGECGNPTANWHSPAKHKEPSVFFEDSTGEMPGRAQEEVAQGPEHLSSRTLAGQELM